MFASYYKKTPLKYRKQRQELVNCGIIQLYRKFLHEQLGVTVIIDCRTTNPCKFKRKLGFNLHDVFNTKEITILELIKGTFEGENMQTQYHVLGYRFYLYFHDHKLLQKLINLDIVIEIMMMKEEKK